QDDARFRRYILRAYGSDFLRFPLLDRYFVSCWKREVDRASWDGDVEGDGVFAGEDCERVGTNLVRDVSVGGDSVSPGDHGADLAVTHVGAGRTVDDDDAGNAVAGELPCSKTGTLQKGPRFVDVHRERTSAEVRGA